MAVHDYSSRKSAWLQINSEARGSHCCSTMMLRSSKGFMAPRKLSRAASRAGPISAGSRRGSDCVRSNRGIGKYELASLAVVSENGGRGVLNLSVRTGAESIVDSTHQLGLIEGVDVVTQKIAQRDGGPAHRLPMSRDVGKNDAREKSAEHMER